MSNSIDIAVLGEDAQARGKAGHELGKKANVDDMAFYHSVFGGKIVNAVEPAAYPAKLPPLLYSIALSDYALVLAPQPSAALGETIVALDLMGLPSAFVALFDLKPLLANSSLESSRIFDSEGEAREFLLSQQSVQGEGSAKVLVDHCFEVKGVGTVALGVVKRGKLHKHDKLMAMPQGREIEAKSIQKNDADVEEAFAGDRVGLAIKGASAEEIPRGSVLFGEGEPKCIVSKEIGCKISLSKFYRGSVLNDAVLHLACGLQFAPCKISCESEIKPGNEAIAKLTLEKPFAFDSQDRLVLCDLNAKGLRVIGKAFL